MMADEIKNKIMQDLSSTLVQILDNMGRQKAIAALEIFKEHEKFRKQLEQMNDAEPEPAVAGDKEIGPDDDFLRPDPMVAAAS